MQKLRLLSALLTLFYSGMWLIPLHAQDNPDIAFHAYQCGYDSASEQVVIRASVNEADGSPPPTDSFRLTISAGNPSISPVDVPPNVRQATLVPRQPLRLLLLLDTTSTMPLETVRQSLSESLLAQLNADDEVAVLAFDTAIDAVTPFQAPRAAQVDLDRIQSDTVTETGTERSNLIYQAIVDATTALTVNNQRQAVLLITDSGPNDTQRAIGLTPAIANATNANGDNRISGSGIQFYVMSFRGDSLPANDPGPADFDMRRLAEATDGFAWVAEDTQSDAELSSWFNNNLSQLRSILAGEIEVRIDRAALPVLPFLDFDMTLELEDGSLESDRIRCDLSNEFIAPAQPTAAPQTQPTAVAQVPAATPVPQTQATPVPQAQPTAVPQVQPTAIIQQAMRFANVQDGQTITPDYPIQVEAVPFVAGNVMLMYIDDDLNWVASRRTAAEIETFAYEWPTQLPGEHRVRIVLETPDGQPVTETEVTIQLERPLTATLNDQAFAALPDNAELNGRVQIVGALQDAPISNLGARGIQGAVVIREVIDGQARELSRQVSPIDANGQFTIIYDNIQAQINPNRTSNTSTIELQVQMIDANGVPVATTASKPIVVSPVAPTDFILPLALLLVFVALGVVVFLRFRLARADYVVHHPDAHDLSRPPMKVVYEARKPTSYSQTYGAPTEKVLDKKTLTIGREATCDIVVPQNYVSVSKVHGILLWRNKAWHYTNCRNRTDGAITKLNGKPIRDRYLHRLETEDVLDFDGYRLSLQRTSVSELPHT